MIAKFLMYTNKHTNWYGLWETKASQKTFDIF